MKKARFQVDMVSNLVQGEYTSTERADQRCLLIGQGFMGI